MTERDDHQLLAEFARANSEAAFAALVQRHLSLVYSTALRSVGSAHAAEEIAQAVFIILAQKAGKLSPRIVLSGWLYQTTRLTAANFLRGEIRRQKREQEAYMQSTLNELDANVWPQIAPLLDDALGKLGETDRNAIVLRFFENKSLAEVGAALGASEDAAKMRVNRALERLRKIFGKRGVALSATLIAGAVSASSVQAAPMGLAATISTAALTKGAVAGGSTLTLVKGALKIMAWTKMKTAVVVSACVLLTAGTATTIIICNQPRPVLGIPKDWSILSGNTDQWNWTNGAINGHSTSGDTILASTRQYKDVTISAIVQTTNRDADFAIRMLDTDNGYLVCFAPDGTPWAADNGSHIQLRKRIAGEESDVATFARRGLPQSGKLTVVAKGSHIEVRWNDITIIKTNDSTFASGFIGVRVFGDPGKPSDGTFSNLTFY